MKLTVTAGDGAREVHGDVGEARAAAVEAARRTGRAEVHRWGCAERSDPEGVADGREVTPSFLVGTATAVKVGGVTVVRWRAPRADADAAAAVMATLDLPDLCRLRVALDARMVALMQATPASAAMRPSTPLRLTAAMRPSRVA